MPRTSRLVVSCTLHVVHDPQSGSPSNDHIAFGGDLLLKLDGRRPGERGFAIAIDGQPALREMRFNPIEKNISSVLGYVQQADGQTVQGFGPVDPFPLCRFLL